MHRAFAVVTSLLAAAVMLILCGFVVLQGSVDGVDAPS